MVQSFAKSRGSRHLWGLYEETPFVTGRIYTMSRPVRFWSKLAQEVA